MNGVRTIALVSDAPGELRERLAAAGSVTEIPLAQLGAGSRPELEAADCAVVVADPNAALSAVRRLHSLAPALQVVLSVPDAERRQLERALLFSPGLGEVWLTAPREVDADKVEAAAEVTRQRRRYSATRLQIEEDLAVVEPQRGRRALVSDAYLASLLQVLPHPVISIDDRDRVLSWNPAAEAFFGLSAAEAVGRDVLDALRPENRAGLELGLAEGARSVHRGEGAFLRPGGDRIAEVTVVPVDAAGHRVRSVVLHDVTAMRRTQGALERQAGELDAQRARLQEQAAELARVNLELQKRSSELENALAARNRFYAAMSHELRTPLNAIIGYNSLLQDGIYGEMEPKQAEAVEKSQRAARHQLELVNDVLDLAKIEAGRIELLVEHVHFPEMLADLLATVRPMAEERGSELRLRDDGDPLTVVTDPRRVRQILLNLLSNAVKFGEGSPIEVGWKRRPEGGVRVDVADHGRGIAPEDVPRIFDEFMQLESRQAGGTGLGLPISRRLAEVLGGSLEVRSAPRRGSTFCLTLPASLPPEAPGPSDPPPPTRG